MKSRNFVKQPREIVVVAHNIRSVFNVGSIFRTSEGFGVSRIFLSGWTPNFDKVYDPTTGKFSRILPHVRDKLIREIHKTALGAEDKVQSEFRENLPELLDDLRAQDFLIVGLEQDSRSVLLSFFAENLDEIYLAHFAERVLNRDAGSIELTKILTKNLNPLHLAKNSKKILENVGKNPKIALILGEEVNGLTEEIREKCDILVEIPMFGEKESFNVASSAAIALYELTTK
jgi:tRNA G18 (ribose-2'-O)-methylase SpoU